MPTLFLENICKSFLNSSKQRIFAVQNLTLALEQNELLALVGPSGCGKTTVLRLIAGLEMPDSGKILLDKNVIHHLSAKDRDIAMVFQHHALFPHLTLFENMALGLKLRKVPKAQIEKQVGEAAAVLGLTGKLNRKPHEVSGGEAQRAALGRALVRQPKVFLLDEPLSSVDAITRKQLRCEIMKLHRTLGVPMIYVTHDQREAMALGQRVAVMNNGVLQQVGTANEIKQRPANEFVAQFFNPEF